MLSESNCIILKPFRNIHVHNAIVNTGVFC